MILILDGICALIVAIKRLDRPVTTQTANPITTDSSMLVVTAKAEQIPSI